MVSTILRVHSSINNFVDQLGLNDAKSRFGKKGNVLSRCLVKYQLLLFLFESRKYLQRVLTAIQRSHRKGRGNCFQLIRELFGELILYKHNIKPKTERHLLLRDHLGRYCKGVNENKGFRKNVALRLITINLTWLRILEGQIKRNALSLLINFDLTFLFYFV